MCLSHDSWHYMDISRRVTSLACPIATQAALHFPSCKLRTKQPLPFPQPASYFPDVLQCVYREPWAAFSSPTHCSFLYSQPNYRNQITRVFRPRSSSFVQHTSRDSLILLSPETYRHLHKWFSFLSCRHVFDRSHLSTVTRNTEMSWSTCVFQMRRKSQSELKYLGLPISCFLKAIYRHFKITTYKPQNDAFKHQSNYS